MDVEKIIAGLQGMSADELSTLLSNAKRILGRDAGNADARRLQSAVESELARKPKKRSKVGGLWWELHNAHVSTFSAYADPMSTIVVAFITKEDTHTGTRKDVYRVQVGDRILEERFSEVAEARRAGSEAWAKGRAAG